MIPPLVLNCECCGRLFLADIALIEDEIICPACEGPFHPESLDGLAAEVFHLGGVMAKAHREIYGNSPFTMD